ncbi:nucleotidyltransferase family protein [Candidatus Uhrbacteria bacterium]|nr:nucleotidyltransferase family protein [Candidatus Uhrbacteria bacterium]
MSDLPSKLVEIIRHEPRLIGALQIVRDLHLPDWYIAAGAIRNTVWDVLHGYTHRTPLNDVDVVYFETRDDALAHDLSLWEKLQERDGTYTWNVFNQARAHEKFPLYPTHGPTSIFMSYWSETPTCVGVRLEPDDTLTISAPHGLEDLFHLRVRPVPPPFQDMELYRRRTTAKRWQETWPHLQIDKDV